MTARPFYGDAVLRNILDNGADVDRFLFVFTDGGALTVSASGSLLRWVEHDFDPWTLASEVRWQDLPPQVRAAALASCRWLDDALRANQEGDDRGR